MMTADLSRLDRTSPVLAAAATLFDRLIHALRRWKNGSRGMAAGEQTAIVARLRRESYVVLPGYYDEARCTSLIAEIDRIMETQPDVVRRDAADADHRIFGIERASSAVAEFHDDRFLQAIGEAYSGGTLQNFSTLAGRLRFQPGNLGSGQGWHRDAFHFQFKAMVYLTDVSEENGPFQILPGSHRAWRVFCDTLTGKLGKAPQSRITDAQAERLLAARPSRLRTLTGPRGTVILFDSSAIHRGAPMRSGSRYALTNYYFQPEHITARRYEEFSPFARPAAVP